MLEHYIGEIRMFALQYVPQNWALCNGQVIQVGMASRLYAIIGNTYGGVPSSTFALPDLRGRAPIHRGEGPGLRPTPIGESSGMETVTLALPDLDAHAHSLVTGAAADQDSLAGNLLGNGNAVGATYGEPTNLVALAADSITPNGASGLPHANMQPSLVMMYCIALDGLDPRD